MRFKALAVICCALLVAACGSAARPRATAAAAGYAEGVAYAKCMRAHGVHDFPDPSTSGVVSFPSALDQAAPAFRSADGACARYLPVPGGPRTIPEGQKLRLLAAARCMRTHGVPNYPDPAFRGGVVYFGGGSGLDRFAPAFRAAAQTCGIPDPRLAPP